MDAIDDETQQELLGESSDGADGISLSFLRRGWAAEDEEIAAGAAKHGRGFRHSRRGNVARNFDKGCEQIYTAYFVENCIYSEKQLEWRFRLPSAVFENVFDRVKDSSFLKRKMNALDEGGIHPLQRVTAAMRMLAYCHAADAMDGYTRTADF